MKHPVKLLVGITSMLVLLTGTSTVLHAQGNIPPVVTVDTVTEVAESGSRKYMGRIEAIENVSLIARVSGFLEKINFKEGDLVKKGDLLFEIEDTTYVAAVKAAEAQLKQAQAELEYAIKNYDRQSSLSTSKIVSESTMEDAVRTKALAEASVLEKEAALIDAQNNLSYTKIYAPISGRIGKSTYSVGNYVTPESSALAKIVQEAPIYVTFAITEPDFDKMFGNAENMKKEAVIRLKTADRQYYSSKDAAGNDESLGKVTLVDNTVDSSTGTIFVWATFPNSEDKLLPGGLVDVFISKKTKKALPAIPITAVMIDSTGKYVYVVGKDNVVERRNIETEEIVGGIYLIRSGLSLGETVIIDGTHKTRPGATVVPVPANAQNAKTNQVQADK